MVPSFQVHMVVRCKEVIPALAVHAGTAEPFRVSPPEAVAYPLKLLAELGEPVAGPMADDPLHTPDAHRGDQP
jgi:hypothetical protein